MTDCFGMWYFDMSDLKWTLINAKRTTVPQPPLCIPHIVQNLGPNTNRGLAQFRITVECKISRFSNVGRTKYVWALRLETMDKKGHSYITTMGCKWGLLRQLDLFFKDATRLDMNEALVECHRSVSANLELPRWWNKPSPAVSKQLSILQNMVQS